MGFRLLPSPLQLVAFSRSYAASSSAQAIASGMQSAGRDLSQRFRQIAAADAQSQRDAAVQLRMLEADRDELYRSIVAQVKAEALTLARQRGLGGVEFVNSRTESRPAQPHAGDRRAHGTRFVTLDRSVPRPRGYGLTAVAHLLHGA